MLDVLALYGRDIIPSHSRPKESSSRLRRLALWWGQPFAAMQTFRDLEWPIERMTGHVTDIRSATCRAYVAMVGKSRTASMDLELLRAALNHAVTNRLLDRTVPVALPPKSLPRERWLTRSEVAKLVWTAWRSRRASNGISGEEDDWAMRKHLARWMLVAHYTGTRKAAILNASFRQEIGRGYMDLDAGLWYRRGAGVRATKKRQPPVPLPAPLLGHLRRWKKNGQIHAVEFGGKPIASIDKAFRNLVVECKLTGEVIPHTFRHTAITWGMQRGMDPWDASGYFGISLQTLLEVYGHHHPDHLRDAAEKMARPKKRNVREA
ncbi:MAG: site-specific integrase [Devosia sp.]|nr:site-specific integrase [Devosia sp.]